MNFSPPSPRLDSPEAIDAHLIQLLKTHPQLQAVRERCGSIAPRISEPGFASLAKIVCGQLLSVASANAIWTRFTALPGALEPAGYLRLDEASVRSIGFSASKYRTVRVIAEALVDGSLDLTGLENQAAEAAVRYLTAHKGIGPWTAEVYLMFCAGHPDVFPAGDMALRRAVQWGLGLDDLPSIKQVVTTASAWAPYRSAAALMFWRYYAVRRTKEGILL